jgi:hypothetical protein
VPFEVRAENQVRHPAEVVPQAPGETARSQLGASPRPSSAADRGDRGLGGPCRLVLLLSAPHWFFGPAAQHTACFSPCLPPFLALPPTRTPRSLLAGENFALCKLNGYSRATTAELGGFRGRGTLGARVRRLRLALPSSDPFTEGVTGGARGCGTWRDMSVSDVSVR